MFKTQFCKGLCNWECICPPEPISPSVKCLHCGEPVEYKMYTLIHTESRESRCELYATKDPIGLL